ncbi:MAG: DUF3149 domain-containing protein [Zoogloeaceae bacterium]|jgi:hypothetical protein|nr:DUF3149 domain-containing protein [Zoogloeaceae bacterium]
MLQELFSNEIGLLSVFTIGFVVVMAIFLPIYFSKKINEDVQNDQK